MTEATTPDTLALALRITELIRERRGADLVLMDVRALVDYTDFFLLASGQSGRQNQAIGEHVVKSLKAAHRYAISKSGLDTGSWICLDMGDVVVHVFDPETRARYDLELLWADAPRVDIAETAPAAESPAGTAVPAGDLVPEPAAALKRRKRVVRRAAVEDADAANAPDSERPPPDEPEPEAPSTPKVSKAPKALKKPLAAKGREPGAAPKKSAEKTRPKISRPATAARARKRSSPR